MASSTTPLSEDDVERLFSGAPQYFARSESHFPGAPHPSVAFPFDEELEIRDLTDHVQVEAKAWSGVTAWPHLTRDVNHDPEARREVEETHRAHFHVRCRERPNMLSMQGLEKGTMGYQAALELAVSDSLEEEQFGFESIGTKAQAVVEARERMCSSRDGWLHRIPQPELLDRLKRNGDVYRSNTLGKKPSKETYNDLFHSLMRPNKVVAVDRKDPHSLTNQISALLKCLGTANVWIDLSHVEWRIRLGQILWGKQHGDDLHDDTSIHDAQSASERAEEKYWLLLQILVSSELLIRLDAITEGEEYGSGSFRQIDVVHFERAATGAVKWSLLLARRWMGNIEVVREESSLPLEPAGLRRGSGGGAPGWLASLASKISLYDQHKHGNRPPSPPHYYTIRGRHGQRQVDGLTHFARKLMWPGIDAYERRISESVHSMAAPATLQPQIPTPSRKDSDKDSYFGAWDVTCQRGHHKERAHARRRRMAAALHASGWLSKSYVFGLMLPGDALSHFLMATLLENDSEALARLGSFANLSSGFVYSEKSFWSTSCIVGRVLAAGKGSAECMGWISTDITPEGMGDGWINIEVHDVAGDIAQLGKKARLWGKKRVERESCILGDGKEDSVLPVDFIIPHENNYSTPPPGVFVEFQSLELSTPADSVHPTPLAEIVATPTTETSRAPDLPSYPARVNLYVAIEGEKDRRHEFSLLYDVNFVTAHPCSPSQRVRVLKSPSSPTLRQIDFSGSDVLGTGSRSVYRTGHPLHKYYNYRVIHVSELLQRQEAELSELLSPSPMPSPPPPTKSKSKSKSAQNEVLVIDCITNLSSAPQSPVLERLETPASSPTTERKGSFSAAAKMHFESRKRQFGSDMEILMRALCAQKGWNAVISRRKRGCLACAIREAGALGWKVIIRVA